MLFSRFKALDAYLAKHQQYWRYNAFPLVDYPDFDGNTELTALLDNIDDSELQIYQQYPERLYPLLQTVIPDLLSMDDELFSISPKTATESTPIPFWLKNGVKGRKWTQIDQFSQHITGNLPILEWCAGKGHLGRLIGYKAGVKVSAVEWNAELCEKGGQLASQQNIQQDFMAANVLTGEADNYLKRHQHAVALHACGDLHRHLIEGVKLVKTEKVSISPCCYHLTVQQQYQPISSRVLQTSELLSSAVLTKQDLKLAVSQQSTSGKRQSQLNDQEVWWRLSFDSLQKSLLNSDLYLTVPSFPKTLLSGSFTDFVIWVITYKQLTIQLPDDLSSFLAEGLQRLKRLRKLELVSQFFRRPLEVWLVYDRALSLEESGYQVDISTFCQPEITPRNILIQASLL